MFRLVNFHGLLLLIVPVIIAQNSLNYPQKSIYNKLTQEDDYQGFAGLINYNRDARMDILQNELTVFVPVR